MLELSDAQLLKLADKDAVRAAGRERAAGGPEAVYASVKPTDLLLPPSYLPQPVQQSDGAQGNLGGDTDAAGGDASDEWGGGGEVQPEGAEGGDEDEWVELTDEDLELLAWMDAYEASEAAVADVEAGADVEDVAVGGGGRAEVDASDVALLQLSDEELETLADGGEALSWGSCSGADEPSAAAAGQVCELGSWCIVAGALGSAHPLGLLLPVTRCMCL
jgi:hypothetical protein